MTGTLTSDVSRRFLALLIYVLLTTRVKEIQESLSFHMVRFVYTKWRLTHENLRKCN
jgi:hypothetical protein